VNLAALVHRVGQIEQEVRRTGVEAEPTEPVLAVDLEYATFKELDELVRLLTLDLAGHASDGSLERLVEIIQERESRGERPPAELRHPPSWRSSWRPPELVVEEPESPAVARESVAEPDDPVPEPEAAVDVREMHISHAAEPPERVEVEPAPAVVEELAPEAPPAEEGRRAPFEWRSQANRREHPSILDMEW
jgi:hypothetical protein